MKALRFLAALLIPPALLCGAAMAASPEAAANGTGAPPPHDVAVYPAELRVSEENGVFRMEKVYCLTPEDDPSLIPTQDFEHAGRTFTLLDVLKNDHTEIDARQHTELVTLNTQTEDISEIILLLEPELEIVTEDGYAGSLSPDYATLTVEAAEYASYSRTVSAQRIYPNLTDADVSLLPKGIEDGGHTLTLADVRWTETPNTPAPRYTAEATYTGTVTGSYATGYAVTVEYTGEVTKTTSDTIVYTAVFTSHGETQIDETEPEAEAEKDGGTKLCPVLIPAALLLLAVIALMIAVVRKRRAK